MKQVCAEIQEKITNAKGRLEKFGPARDQHQQRLTYLLQLATRFQELFNGAMGKYRAFGDFFKNHSNLKLATIIRQRNESFLDDMQKYGQTIDFEAKDDHEQDSRPMQTLEPNHSTKNVRANKRKFTEICSILERESMVSEPKRSISNMEWLGGIYDNNCGLGPATCDSNVLAMAWEEQTVKWEKIALGYVSDVVTMVHAFMIDLLDEVVPDQRIRKKLVHFLTKEAQIKYRASLEQTKTLLEIARGDVWLLQNDYFATNQAQ